VIFFKRVSFFGGAGIVKGEMSWGVRAIAVRAEAVRAEAVRAVL